jgi:acetyl-CoA carboxylase biotin carboxyl carrier protein
VLTFEQIKELIEMVAENGLQGVEIDRSGFRVRIEGRPAEVMAAAPAAALAAAPPASPSAPQAPASRPAAAAAEEVPAQEEAPSAAAAGAHVLASPIVGTFYASPNPDAPPFVRIGDRVEVGQVLCIVEAMKLMNEIEADANGVVVEVYPKNAQPVEFGEPLFAIQTD